MTKHEVRCATCGGEIAFDDIRPYCAGCGKSGDGCTCLDGKVTDGKRWFDPAHPDGCPKGWESDVKVAPYWVNIMDADFHHLLQDYVGDRWGMLVDDLTVHAATSEWVAGEALRNKPDRDEDGTPIPRRTPPDSHRTPTYRMRTLI